MATYATNKGAKAVFLFIAELLGYKSGTEAGKIAFGQQAYVSNKLHDLNYQANIVDTMTKEEREAELARAENDRADAHENIWLQRLYNDLDRVYGITTLAAMYKRKVIEGTPFDKVFGIPEGSTKQWTVPIELDAGASMLQYIAVLLNDRRLMKITNLIGDNGELNDPWSCPGVPRTMFKHAATPRLYGSSQPAHVIWTDWKHKYTLEQLSRFNEELRSGALGIADTFKEFIITSCNPKSTMTVSIWNLDFEIECNRFFQKGVETRKYNIYDTEDGKIRTLQHTKTKSFPDLEQFRRYFVTLLIHHLDSRVADTVIGKYTEKYGSGIDIYDAFVINPEAAEDVRTWYGELLETIHRDRKLILQNYFKSIGVDASAQGRWESLTSRIHQFEGTFKCRGMALK